MTTDIQNAFPIVEAEETGDNEEKDMRSYSVAKGL